MKPRTTPQEEAEAALQTQVTKLIKKYGYPSPTGGGPSPWFQNQVAEMVKEYGPDRTDLLLELLNAFQSTRKTVH